MVRPHCGESLLVAEYKGTYDLDLKNFPFVRNEDESISNILTRHMTVGDKKNPQYLLYPSMHEGEMLDDPEKSALEGKHFGVYGSKAEMEEADKRIHKDHENQFDPDAQIPLSQSYQKLIGPIISEQDATIVEVFGDKSQSADNVKGFLKALIGN